MRGEPWQTDPAGTDHRGHWAGCIPGAQSGWYLRGCRGVPGGPWGQVVPARHAAQAAPAGKEDGGAQGSRAPVRPSWLRGRDGGTLLGTGDGPAALRQTKKLGTGHQPLANAMAPATEVLTSRPGSPCFPGSPCRQGGGEARSTHPHPSSIPSPEQRVSRGTALPAPSPTWHTAPTHRPWGQPCPPPRTMLTRSPAGPGAPGLPSSPLRPSSPGGPRSPCKRAGWESWSRGAGHGCHGAALSPQPPHLLSRQASVPGVTLRGGKRSEHCAPLNGSRAEHGPPTQTPVGKGALTRAPGGPRGPSTPCKRDTLSSEAWGGRRVSRVLTHRPCTPGPSALPQNVSHLAALPPPAPKTRHLPSLQAGRGSRHHPGRPSRRPRRGPRGPPARES